MRPERPRSRPAFRLSGLFVLTVTLLLAAGCGAGDGNAGKGPAPSPPAVGWNGEVEDAPYIAYERVSFARLPKDRVEPAGELRLPQQVRRVSAFRLRGDETNAIRFTSDGAAGWLAWQPSVVLSAVRELARSAGARASEVTTLGVRRVQWPDTCLSVPGSGCRAEVTPGFSITLRLRGTHYLYHSDLRERVVAARG